MNAVRILGLGPVLACGQGVEALTLALAGGGAEASAADITAGLSVFMPPARTRRLDPLGRMALLSSYLAVRDAGLASESARSERWGIVVGTAFGPQASTFSYLDGLIDSGDHLVSSLAFTNSVHNLPAAQVSLALGISGPVTTVTAFGDTAGAAFQTARGWIRAGRADRVLLILGEEASPVLTSAVGWMGAGAGPVRPLEEGCSYAPQPGCTALLLGGGAGGYAGLGEVAEGLTTDEAAARAAGVDCLFCAASGRADEAADYRALAARAGRVRAHAHLYGSLAAGPAVETAIAALAVAGRTAEPAFPGGPKPRTAAVACVSGTDRVTLMEIEE